MNFTEGRFGFMVPEERETLKYPILTSNPRALSESKLANYFSRFCAKTLPMSGRKGIVVTVLVVLGVSVGSRELYKTYKDDNAFGNAEATNSPFAYAEYLARAGGRHKDDARRLYSKALAVTRQEIRKKPCHGEGKRPVLLMEMLDFADKSGNDDVAVVINRNLEVGPTVTGEQDDETIRLQNGKSEKLVSASRYFEYVPRQDQYIAYSLVQRFDERLRGVFNFEGANAASHSMILRVDYTVGLTGRIYRIERRKKDEEPDLTLLYNGLKYTWKVELGIPERATEHFEFTTDPPPDFKVDYRRPRDPWGESTGPNDLEIYHAMERSAFEDFYKVVLEQLCAEPAQSPQTGAAVH